MGALEDLMMNAREISPQRDIMRMVAPNYTSVLEGNPNPRQFPMNAPPGKIPSMDDPRMGGSVLEALMLAGSAAPAGRMAMGAGGAARMIPEMMQSAPGIAPMVGKTAAGGATLASILGGTGEAGENPEQPFTWSDSNAGRVKRLNDIDKEMKMLSTTKTPSAPGTQAQRLKVLGTEQEKLLGDQSTEYNAAKEQFDTAQTNARTAAKTKEWQEMSWNKAYPGLAGAAGAASPVVSYLTGKLPGSKIANPVGAAAVGAIGGGLEGTILAHAPNYLDQKLPSGPAKEAAIQKNASPEYWTSEVAPIAAVNALSGGLGAYRKNLALRPNITYPSAPGSPPQGGAQPNPPTSGSVAAPVAAPKTRPSGPGSYVTYTMPDGGKVVETPHGWRGINPETGKQTGFIKRPDGPLERLMKGE